MKHTLNPKDETVPGHQENTTKKRVYSLLRRGMEEFDRQLKALGKRDLSEITDTEKLARTLSSTAQGLANMRRLVPDKSLEVPKPRWRLADERNTQELANPDEVGTKDSE